MQKEDGHRGAGTRGSGRRRLPGRLLTAGTAALLLVGLTPGTADAAAKTWTVAPGGSIQAAVDSAKSGDTIVIKAGTYSEAVCVDRKGLTIKGAGRDSTILQPPASFLSKPACWDNPDFVSGLHFEKPTGPVTVTDLQTKNYPQNGIYATGANGFTVKRTKGIGLGVYGILATYSTRIAITDNIEMGSLVPGTASGTAGVSVADTGKAVALIQNNQSIGWHLGIFVREARTGSIVGNTVKSNCIGVLVFDDSTTDDGSTSYIGGDWAVLRNKSTANNSFCLAGRDLSQRVSGVGMSIVNTDHVLVAGNIITGNKPSQEVNYPAGGLTVLGYPSPASSPGPDPGPAEYVQVLNNTIRDNAPVDVLLGSPGPGNVFKGNNCTIGVPETIC